MAAASAAAVASRLAAASSAAAAAAAIDAARVEPRRTLRRGLGLAFAAPGTDATDGAGGSASSWAVVPGCVSRSADGVDSGAGATRVGVGGSPALSWLRNSAGAAAASDSAAAARSAASAASRTCDSAPGAAASGANATSDAGNAGASPSSLAAPTASRVTAPVSPAASASASEIGVPGPDAGLEHVLVLPLTRCHGPAVASSSAGAAAMRAASFASARSARATAASKSASYFARTARSCSMAASFAARAARSSSMTSRALPRASVSCRWSSFSDSVADSVAFSSAAVASERASARRSFSAMALSARFRSSATNAARSASSRTRAVSSRARAASCLASIAYDSMLNGRPRPTLGRSAPRVRVAACAESCAEPFGERGKGRTLLYTNTRTPLARSEKVSMGTFSRFAITAFSILSTSLTKRSKSVTGVAAAPPALNSLNRSSAKALVFPSIARRALLWPGRELLDVDYVLKG